MPPPDFVIVGERRCGSTSLAHLLEAHPDIALHSKREIGYFIEDEARRGRSKAPSGTVVTDPENWERTHSPEGYARLFDAVSGAASVGEKSADYLFWRPAHERIARFLPDARFIVTLREPVSRAWSHYWNEVAKGRELLGFDEALAAEDERCSNNAYALNHLSYARRGFYDDSLSSFLDHVGRERVHIVLLDDMRRDPDARLADIFTFLGVDLERWSEPEREAKNENWAMVPKPWVHGTVLQAVDRSYDALLRGVAKQVTRDKVARRRRLQSWRRVFREPARDRQMSDAARERLRTLYEPHVVALEKLIGRPLAEWRSR